MPLTFAQFDQIEAAVQAANGASIFKRGPLAEELARIKLVAVCTGLGMAANETKPLEWAIDRLAERPARRRQA